MRAILPRQALLASVGALIVSGCGIVQPSPLTDQVLPQWPGATTTQPAPATPAAPVAPPPKPKTASTGTASAVAGTTSGAGGGNASAASEAGSSFDNVEFVDDSLKGKLAILRVGSEPTATHLLAVFAGLKNKTAHRLNLEVQTIYKDKSDAPLNTGSWISLTLPPHGDTEYHSASISDQAVDFLIRIRRAAPAKSPPSSATP